MSHDPHSAPSQRGLVPSVTVQQLVQFAILLQLAKHCAPTLSMTAALCPGTDRRDLETALGHLLDARSIEGPTWRLTSLVALAEAGQFTLTALGQQRLDEDDV